MKHPIREIHRAGATLIIPYPVRVKIEAGRAFSESSERQSQAASGRGGERLNAIGKYLLWGCIALFWCTSIAWAQDRKNFRFQHLSTMQGLSQSTVYTILQDRQGFVWLGTRDGLNRYDGYEIRTFRHDPDNPDSLSSNFILDLVEDEQGILWIATTQGLNAYDRNKGEKFQRFVRQQGDPSSLPGTSIQTIARADGDLWLGTLTGLIHMEKDGPTYRLYPLNKTPEGLQGSQVWCILPTDNGLWVGTNQGGLFYMDKNRPGQFERFANDPDKPTSLAGTEVITLHLDNNNTLWVGTRDGGLQSMSLDKPGIFQKYTARHGLTSKWIMSLFEDKDGVMWVGTYDRGLFRRDPKTPLRFTHYGHQPGVPTSLSKDNVWTIYQDRMGMMWVGTYGGGANIFDPNGMPFLNYRYGSNRKGLIGKDVQDVVVDSENNIWVATGSGLTQVIRHNREHLLPLYRHFRHNPEYPDSLPGDAIVCMASQGDDLWIGTRTGGLGQMSLKRPGRFKAYRHVPNNDRSLVQDKVACLFPDEGKLWVGSDLGLSMMTLDQPGVFERYQQSDQAGSISNDWIMEILRGAQGRLWVATYGGGLNLMEDEEAGRFVAIRHNPKDPQSLSNDSIRSMMRARDGSIWVGTAGGLNLMKDDRTFRAYRQADGLPNDVIYSIQEDPQNRIWVSTNRGLSCLDLTTDTFTNYDVHDGLQGNEFSTGSSASGYGGELFFGGQDGLTAFFPDQIVKNQIPPEVVLTRLYIDNKEVVLGKETTVYPLQQPITTAESLHLHYSERILALSFAGIHFGDPFKHRYRYRLKGFDRNWVETNAGNRRATYTNLESGDYTFQVQACNEDGVWNEDGASLAVHVETEPWNTWWARSLMGLLAVMLFLYHQRNQQIRLEQERMKVEHLKQVERLKDEFNKQLEKKVEARTRDLKSTRRKLVETARMAGMAEIASDVLHSVGNALTSVKTSVQLMQEQSAQTKWLDLLERLAEEVDGHSDDLVGWLQNDPRSSEIPRALRLISAKLRKQQQKMHGEGDKLWHLVQHIVSVLIEQQKYTKDRGWNKESYDLNLLVGDVLLSEYYLFQDSGIEVDESLSPLRPVEIDRGKVSRMLFFLFKNAAEAIETLGPKKGLIKVSTRQQSERVLLDVEDNGAGIDPTTLDRVFEHGFSTKQEGAGLGLHYCANAMKEMNGEIEIVSPGAGQGCKVRLIFHLNQNENAETTE